MKKRDELINGCLSKVDDEEPIFVLRGKDKLAPLMIRIWAMFAEFAGVDKKKVNEAHRFAKDMKGWQYVNGCKIPD